jgi:ABC-2 type transport system permease protein
VANKTLTLLVPGVYSLRSNYRGGAMLRRIPFTALGLGFWVLLYAGTAVVLSYVREIEFFGELLARRLFSLMFFSLMGFLFLSNLVTAISSFYLSDDLRLLRTLPVEDEDILAQKTFYSMVNSSWMVASFIPPVLVAFGVQYGAGAGYYLMVLLGFVLFMLITGGLGITAAHVLTRLFPAGRVRDALLFAGLVFFLLVYYFLRSSVPEDLRSPVEMVNMLMSFRVESPLLPSFWITEAVMPYLSGGRADWLYIVLLISSGAFFLMLSMLVGKRLFGGNLDRLVPSGGTRAGARFYPGQKRVMLYKDVKVFMRDKAQWSQLLVILALAFVYVYNFKLVQFDAVAHIAPFIREGVLLANLLMAGMVLSAVAARFLYTAVSAEGRAFWLIKSSPVSIRGFLLGKFIYGAMPVTVLTLAMVAVTNIFMGMSDAHMLVSVATVLVLGFSISGLGTGLGAINPRFKYENLASVSMSLGGLGFMLIAFVLVVVTLFIEAWVVYLYYSTGVFNWTAAVSATVLILAINFASAYFPMKMGIRSLSYNTHL